MNGVHVFDVAGRAYAYDRTRQDLVAVAPELADLLAGRTSGGSSGDSSGVSSGGTSGSSAAREALARAQRDDGLFRGVAPLLTPRPPDPACDRDLEHLVLTVTEECDLRCAYCVHGAGLDWVRSHSSRRMDLGTARRAVAWFLDRCRPDRPPTVSFYGGEALRHPALIRAVTAQVRAHPRGAEAMLALDSNGWDWDDAAVAMMAAERMHVQVSLDGPPEIHDRHRRDREGRPTCARILANLDRLLDRDATAAARLSFVATLAPPVDLDAVARFYADLPPFARRGLPAPHVRVNFANLAGQAWPAAQEAAHGLPPVPEQIDRARETWFAAVAAGRRAELSPVVRALFEPDLIRFHHRSRAELGPTWVPGGNCRPGRRKLHVTADGRLQPCERTGDGIVLGDLKTRGGIDPVAVRTLERNFHAAVADRCGDCWALRLCAVCYAALAGGRPGAGKDSVPEQVCERFRSRAEATLALMVRITELPPERREWLENTRLV